MIFYGYCRVSTEEQSDHSLVNQSKYLKIQSGKKGYTFKEYKEKLSGKNSNRPLLQDIIHRLVKGDILGVYDNSRLGRNTTENIGIAEEVSRKGAILQINGKDVDISNPNDKLMLTIESAVSTWQRDNQNLKSAIGIETKREHGEWIFISTMYGWKLSGNNKNPIVDIVDNEAKAIKLAFKLYMTGMSVRKVTMELNDLGYTTRKGKELSADMVRKWLLRPIYMGYYSLHGPGANKTVDTKKVEKSDLIKSKYYTPIIDEKLWWDVYNSYRTLTRVHSRQFEYRHSDYPLTSVIKCGTCGTSYVHNISKRKRANGIKIYNYYKNVHCPKDCTQIGRSLRDTAIEPLFEQLFYIGFLFSEDVNEYIEKIKHEFEVTNMELIHNRDSLISYIRENEKKIQNFYKVLETGISLEQIIPRIKTLEDEVNEQKDRLRELEVRISSSEKDLYEQIDDFSDDSIRNFLLSSPTDKRKKYLENFDSVKCTSNEFKIKYHFDMDATVFIDKVYKGRSQKYYNIEINRKGRYFSTIVWDCDKKMLSVSEDDNTKKKMVELKLKDLKERININYE